MVLLKAGFLSIQMVITAMRNNQFIRLIAASRSERSM